MNEDLSPSEKPRKKEYIRDSEAFRKRRETYYEQNPDASQRLMRNNLEITSKKRLVPSYFDEKGSNLDRDALKPTLPPGFMYNWNGEIPQQPGLNDLPSEIINGQIAERLSYSDQNALKMTNKSLVDLLSDRGICTFENVNRWRSSFGQELLDYFKDFETIPFLNLSFSKDTKVLGNRVYLGRLLFSNEITRPMRDHSGFVLNRFGMRRMRDIVVQQYAEISIDRDSPILYVHFDKNVDLSESEDVSSEVEQMENAFYPHLETALYHAIGSLGMRYELKRI